MISVVLAVHNEEGVLEACLNSVKHFADEIIVVDGESSDTTVLIAKQHNATVIKTTNKPNFHINKQMAIDAAKGDLILQLDADEVVGSELAAYITKQHSQIQQTHYAGPVAWWLKRKNLFFATYLKKGGQYPDPVIRLFVKGKARLPMKDVHEQMQVDGETGEAEGHLLHNSNPTLEAYITKFNRYTSFKATQLQEQGVTISIKNWLLFTLYKPTTTFFSLFIRHKGFQDGLAGFLFAVLSGLHHTVSYLKLVEIQRKERT
ncbi:MAG: glycosyltransferase family 2 protein [Pseudomonadales bacterium]|nr:glycosyltransferase family 2 protein [Candidatus Woesebacteria bacterium]MCB9802196.1 glycosyltransferase family 2 protein [Pseudomonadales bacterium]